MERGGVNEQLIDALRVRFGKHKKEEREREREREREADRQTVRQI